MTADNFHHFHKSTRFLLNFWNDLYYNRIINGIYHSRYRSDQCRFRGKNRFKNEHYFSHLFRKKGTIQIQTEKVLYLANSDKLWKEKNEKISTSWRNIAQCWQRSPLYRRGSQLCNEKFRRDRCPCGVLLSGCLRHDFFTYSLLKSLSAICRYFLPFYLYYFVLVRVI